MFSLCVPLAQAQDYYESDGGLYWGVRGGLSQLRQTTSLDWGGFDDDPATAGVDESMTPHHEWRNLEMDYGYVVGASIGYTMAFPESAADLRFELEGIYRKNDDGETNAEWVATGDGANTLAGHYFSPIDGSIEVRSAMFNVLVDFHTPTRFTPYLGVGAGISQLELDVLVYDIPRITYGYPYPYWSDETVYALSWQAIAGIGYRLSPGTMLTLEFRYFRLAADRFTWLSQVQDLDSLKFDDWSIGARFTF
ncbi:MAG: porin family protein [Proteobacteria bacterium]|nr:porin family protein [Pseudomonadota bacterium]